MLAEPMVAIVPAASTVRPSPAIVPPDQSNVLPIVKSAAPASVPPDSVKRLVMAESALTSSVPPDTRKVPAPVIGAPSRWIVPADICSVESAAISSGWPAMLKVLDSISTPPPFSDDTTMPPIDAPWPSL